MAVKVTQALIYAELQNIKAVLDEHTKVDNQNFQELRQLFEGTNGTPGIKIRLDRIEQKETSRGKHLAYLWSALSALVVGLVLKFWNS